MALHRYRLRMTNLDSGRVYYMNTSYFFYTSYRGFEPKNQNECKVCGRPLLGVEDFDSRTAASNAARRREVESEMIPSNRCVIDIVQVELDCNGSYQPGPHGDVWHLHTLSEKVVRQVWPKPTVLDKLASI